jgi:hypothetical protein
MFFKKHVGTTYIAYKTFLSKEFYNSSSNSEKRNSIFMKGNRIFSKCALKEHLKMLRSVLQTASKNFETKLFNSTQLKLVFLLLLVEVFF